jgi:hypothetical protein
VLFRMTGMLLLWFALVVVCVVWLSPEQEFLIFLRNTNQLVRELSCGITYKLSNDRNNLFLLVNILRSDIVLPKVDYAYTAHPMGQ